MKKLSNKKIVLFSIGCILGCITIVLPLFLFFYVFPTIVKITSPNYESSYTPWIELCLSDDIKSCSINLDVHMEEGNTILQTLQNANYYYIDTAQRKIEFSSWECDGIPLSRIIKLGENYLCYPKEPLPKNIVIHQPIQYIMHMYDRP